MRRLLLTTSIALFALAATAGPAAACRTVSTAPYEPSGVDGADDEITIVHARPVSASSGADLHLDVAVTSTCRAESWLLTECSHLDVAVRYDTTGSDAWRTVETTLDPAGGHATLTVPGWDISGPEVRYQIIATQEQCAPLDWSTPCHHLEEQTEVHAVAVA